MLPSALGSRDTSDSTMPAVNRSKFAVSVTVPVRADAVISSASFAFSDRNGPSRGTNSLSAKLLALVRLSRRGLWLRWNRNIVSADCVNRSCGSSARSEEHTSELQSLMRISYAVFCLKKKIKHQQ